MKKLRLPRLKISTIVLIGIFVVSILLNVIARLSSTFADLYLEYVFPIWNHTFGRLCSWVPFSVGEILIILALIGIPLSLITYILLMIFKKNMRKVVTKLYIKTIAWCLAYVVLTETLNCFIFYQCSTFASKNGISENTYTVEQLLDLYEVLAKQTNEASAEIERDENGCFVLNADLSETAKENLLALSDRYPVLDGFYTTPKPVINSYFMSQQYLMGIYFPFTLEANYNHLMYSSNKPCTVTHELVHTQGIILEDECNFIAFLACSESDDADYRYSGYLSALKYVLNKSCDAVADMDDSYKLRYNEITYSLDIGVIIDIAENQSYWESVQEEDEGLLPSDVVDEMGDEFIDANLKFNGVEDGRQSYGRMVDLLLNYYSDKGLI